MIKNLFIKAMRRLEAVELLPAYDYVQVVLEQNIHNFIGKKRNEIERICIVGGHLGHEVPRLLRRYPNAIVTIFEPSGRYKEHIEKRFLRESRVEVRKIAVSDFKGEATFYETSLEGSGSLLPLGEKARAFYSANEAEMFKVDVDTLNNVMCDTRIDCLWIDVQGAELLVLKGASEILSRVQSVFIEVSRLPDLYQGGGTQKELVEFLSVYGFEMTLLGLESKTLTGNAFFTRNRTENLRTDSSQGQARRVTT